MSPDGDAKPEPILGPLRGLSGFLDVPTFGGLGFGPKQQIRQYFLIHMVSKSEG